MKNFTEVRWHGRGGQGTVTAAKVFAETALSGGHYVQAFPEYGPERMGAPLRAYNRVSKQPITLHCHVTNPNMVVIVDPSLIGNIDVLEGSDKETVLLINTPQKPDEMKEKLSLPVQQKVFTVDASKIAMETIGRPMPNTPMLGALAKISGVIGLENLIADTEKNFSKKFSPAVVAANIKAIKRAYEEVIGG